MISTADKIRIALAPLHLFLGAALVYRYVQGIHTPLVLCIGGLFVAFGLYKIRLVSRALAAHRRGQQ